LCRGLRCRSTHQIHIDARRQFLDIEVGISDGESLVENRGRASDERVTGREWCPCFAEII
jgi:hypothetical protein